MKKNILFVDDDKFLLAGLQRLLRNRRKEWDMEFVDSSSAALECMSNKEFDAVVTDMRMPGMDGSQLLQKVRELYPGTVRLILSGQSDEETVFRAIGPAHQYLSKPSTSEEIKSAISRACALRDYLANDAVRKLVGEINHLPSLSSEGTDLVALLQDPEAGVGDIGDAIAKDMALTTKVLQLANSPLFGTQNQISDPKHAVALLGLGHIRPLVLSASLYSQFSISDSEEFSIEDLMDRSVAVGGLAKKIATAESAPSELIDQSMVAGMLHEIGKILLIDQIPDKYRAALKLSKEKGIPLWEAEKETIGATHSEIGAYLLAMWGLPAPVVEAVAFCHNPQSAEIDKFAPLISVHVASKFTSSEPMDAEFINKSLGIEDPMAHWQKILEVEETCAAGA